MALPIPKGISKHHTSPYAAIDVNRPELSAAGKVIFITGGGSGLGLAFAQHFAKAGCTSITITGRRKKVIDEAKASLEKQYRGLKILAVQGDVTDKQAVERAFKQTEEIFGSVNVLINNAGYLPSYIPIASSSVAEWWKGFEVNVLGSFHVLSSFHPVAASDAVVISELTCQESILYISDVSFLTPYRYNICGRERDSAFAECVHCEQDGGGEAVRELRE